MTVCGVGGWGWLCWEDGGGCVGGNGMMVMCALRGCGVEVRGTMVCLGSWLDSCRCRVHVRVLLE